MQASKRHVLTIDNKPAVKTVLDELSAEVESNGGVPHEIRRGFADLSSRGGTRLILDLQVIEPPAGGSPSIKNMSAYLAGEVLIVVGQVTAPWILRIRELGRGRSFSDQLASSVRALVSGASAQIETAALRVTSAVRRNKENLGRVHAR